MKTLKKILFVIASFTMINLGTSCNNGNSASNDANDSKKEAEKHNDAKFDGKEENDADFVVAAADINLKEMKFGELAENKGSSADTKELGNMMSKDHKKAYDELSSLAAKKSITIPTAMTEAEQKKYNDLAAKTGTDFDKSYVDMMVDGHKEAIDKFEKASKDSKDADIQVWATNMLPTLRTHLDHAMNCQKMVDNMK